MWLRILGVIAAVVLVAVGSYIFAGDLEKRNELLEKCAEASMSDSQYKDLLAMDLVMLNDVESCLDVGDYQGAKQRIARLRELKEQSLNRV